MESLKYFYFYNFTLADCTSIVHIWKTKRIESAMAQKYPTLTLNLFGSSTLNLKMKRKFCLILLLASLHLITYSQASISSLSYANKALLTKNSPANNTGIGDIYPDLLPVIAEGSLKDESDSISKRTLPVATPESHGIDGTRMIHNIDSIANLGILEKAYPGCVVLVARHGNTIFEKAYGTYNYDDTARVTVNSIFDLASVTKICAATLSVMKLYDKGKIRLDKSLGTYLPWVRNSDKEDLNIEKIMLHEARLVPAVVFYRQTFDSVTGLPSSAFFRKKASAAFKVRVAQNLFLKSDYWKTMNRSIVTSQLLAPDKYIYSDNDFIFIGDVVKAVSGLRLDAYADKNFYKPMGLTSIGFNPSNRFDTSLIAPTEIDNYFRHQHLRGDVHDEGAAMFGGVAGHAGLFSNAQDIAALLQMLLEGGSYKGHQYLKPETIAFFTANNSRISRRGIGFDKPQKDNFTTSTPDPYPSRYASQLTFGHTGYTGTAVWADPEYDLVYVFLSNRVNPTRSTKLFKLNITGEILDAVYKAMTPAIPPVLQRAEMGNF